MSVVVVMGVAGCGKTSVGAAVAQRLGRSFVDADDHHPDANRAKMRAGVALDDADREPWLDALNRILHSADDDVVLACSALTRAYRRRLLDGVADAVVVHLDVSPAVAERRVRDRRGHFMPVDLVASQFDTLEPPLPDEGAVVVDAGRALDDVVVDVCRALRDRD